MTPVVILCTMPKDLCFFCGEWVHVEGGDILHNDHWYCSDECVEDLETIQANYRNRVSDWCPSCGYDNHEHAEGCATK